MLFKNLVKEVIDNFITNESAFSIHDVTKEVRTRVNNNPSAIDDKPIVDVPVGQTFTKTVLVDHTEVKNIVYSFLPEMDALGYVREHNGVYWEFKPVNGASAPVGNASTPVSGGAYDGVPSFATPATPVAPADSSTPVAQTPAPVAQTPAPVVQTPADSSKDGLVHVRGFTRNGKWVNAYTRSYPKLKIDYFKP